jgi:hypothetical protein
VQPEEVAQWLAAAPGALVHDDLMAFAHHLLERDANPRTGH